MQYMKNIKRSLYIEKVKPFISKNVIKVLVGQRRVGKSFILVQLMDEIRKNISNPNIIFINKEFDEFRDLDNNVKLSEYIKQNEKKEKLNYLFIDEVQDIKDFEISLRNLQAKGNFDIYCTGSNANLLSGELATYLSGRYIEIKINSLSYIEFLEFHKLNNNLRSLDKFLRYGGLPYLINLPLDDKIIFDYLKNIYAAILYKDLVARYSIRNINFLEKLVFYLADNIGSIVSGKRISEFLKSQNTLISIPAVLNYLFQLNSVFFINKVSRSEIHGKKIFEIGEKYYFEDIGIRNAIIGYNPAQINKILENVVYLHLKICNYTIYVGTENNNEIDFVCSKENRKLYVQVAFRLTEKSTQEREFGNLIRIKDHYPKIVVSLDEIFTDTNIEGVQHVYLQDFLSNYNV